MLGIHFSISVDFISIVVGIIGIIVTLLSVIIALLKIKKKTVTISEKTNIYKSSGKKGFFTFNYSNNNGEYVISDGEVSFATRWSKASNTSIHAYNDGERINAIALIKQVNNIEDLDNIEADFSSRCRTAQIGDAIIWRNENKKYAITKILNIKDDTRGDSEDELTCEYFIF